MKPKAVIDGTRMRSVVCSKCEPASQRGEFSQKHLQLQLQGPAFTCCERLSKLRTGCFVQDLPAPNVKFGIALEKNA